MCNKDGVLINKAVSGDLDAFQQIVQEHQTLVYRSAFRILADEEDARDATQECFIRVWKNLYTFDATKRFTTWLYKIIVNVCYDELRKAYRRRKRSLNDREFSLADQCDIETETMNAELAHKIHLVSEGLKPRQRMVFALRDLQGLDMHDIAEILGISVSAVKSNLFYARKNIREKMRKQGFTT